MLSEEHFKLLKQLESPDSSERRDANVALMEKEALEETAVADLLGYLKVTDNPVYQVYIVDALGRMQATESYPILKDFFVASKNPLTLAALLEAFKVIRTDDFVDVVLAKLQGKESKVKTDKFKISELDAAFDRETILDYIFIPALKYLQAGGHRGIKKAVLPWLRHKNPKIRWNTLLVFDRVKIPIDEKILISVKNEDSSAFNREQAAIMLEKAKTRNSSDGLE